MLLTLLFILLTQSLEQDIYQNIFSKKLKAHDVHNLYATNNSTLDGRTIAIDRLAWCALDRDASREMRVKNANDGGVGGVITVPVPAMGFIQTYARHEAKQLAIGR